MNLRRALLLAFLAATLVGAWWFTPDASAARQVDSGLKRALASFASARTLDAIVSAAQGTELSMQPLGVGLTLAPGEALDPINDLIEQFAGLMLAASVSFGAQRVLIAAGGHWVVSALLSVVAIAWVAWRWRETPDTGAGESWLSRWLSRALLLLLLVRFAVPLAVLGADVGFKVLMADDYVAGQAVLDRSATAMRELSPPTVSAEPATEAGTLERLRRWWSGPAADAKPGAAPPSRIEQWQTIVGDAVEHIVRLIVVFLMQTLVLPLLTLWLLLGLVKRSLGDAR